MRQVLVNPLSGYYMDKDVFGTQGDFITSPEISQLFGEMTGIWYLTEWMRLGKPKKTQLVELGPGRGTLMSDMLRTLAQFPYFYETITGIHLVEASPGLRKIQRSALTKNADDVEGNVEKATRADGIDVFWHDGVEVVPEGWSCIMAHEFFDALAVHSFEKTKDGWRELLVDFDDTDETQSLADLISRGGGTGLVIDYGQDYAQGDTLRAIKKHQIVHPMSDPGSADLSVDVDFAALKLAMGSKYPDITTHGPVTQSKFLQSLGIQTRLEMLLKNAKTSESRTSLVKGFQRLLDPAMMGRIYKVMSFAKENDATKEKPVGFQ
ncbi:S-adenosyl-L-methionine-dependent methyltransferase [Zychaea mexicana]|uniref:S-adenosyl-L-methionine-dependent methyltransferase n=1 Tax=Zychaea mexicana TaxID=64656 RepID=UPI0022FE3EC5|nr:S-adenosyl-L-methionine-dependent methyltransferase [Zychaea mexicana]KAI9490728.1 S-adenosyl-L-methionine-dependent methyltransferase [Zychaea mexicana]